MNEGFKDVSLPWYCALYFHYFYFCADAHTNSSPCELVQLHLFVCLFACILRLMNQLCLYSSHETQTEKRTEIKRSRITFA